MNLLFITGTRADFGKLEPLAREASNRNHNITFFITGMHLLKKYGNTSIEVKRLKNVNFYDFVNQKLNDPQDIILAKTISGLSDYVYENKPDLVIIHGDRVEALAASIVCALNNIRSIHIEGGEVSGTIDESIRHCNTKLCTHHFVSSINAKNRVRALGESESRISVIGSPELDVHSKDSGVTICDVKKHYDIKYKDYGIMAFHPVTTERETLQQQIETVCKALNNTNKHFIVILPNNDPGCDIIFDAYRRFFSNDNFKILPSMRFNYFSELMKNASIMIGNSSAGVREAPFFGLPSIDIGTRQKNRALSKSVCVIENVTTENIIYNINQLWNKKKLKDESFGEGKSSKLFVEMIESKDFLNVSIQKHYDSK